MRINSAKPNRDLSDGVVREEHLDGNLVGTQLHNVDAAGISSTPAGISSTPAQPHGSVQPWAGEKDPADEHRLMSQDYKRLCMLVLTVLLQPASDESKEGKHSLFPHNEAIHQWKREFTPLLFRWLEYPFEDRINSIRAINVNAEQQIL